jgi:hypothetical protein
MTSAAGPLKSVSHSGVSPFETAPKIQTPLFLPDDLKKQLEKHAKKQMKNIEKRLRTGEDTKTKTKDRDGLK